ncbi:hypothetical protein V5O48_017957 [Marasmius crinis-equi]|uniref:Uncharacterized protein n=1 Tax=Marasmius crinis-equi TaxID=585013 RepID=A0ABR3EMJ4_9AGAR
MSSGKRRSSRLAASAAGPDDTVPDSNSQGSFANSGDGNAAHKLYIKLPRPARSQSCRSPPADSTLNEETPASRQADDDNPQENDGAEEKEEPVNMPFWYNPEADENPLDFSNRPHGDGPLSSMDSPDERGYNNLYEDYQNTGSDQGEAESTEKEAGDFESCKDGENNAGSPENGKDDEDGVTDLEQEDDGWSSDTWGGIQDSGAILSSPLQACSLNASPMKPSTKRATRGLASDSSDSEVPGTPTPSHKALVLDVTSDESETGVDHEKEEHRAKKRKNKLKKQRQMEESSEEESVPATQPTKRPVGRPRKQLPPEPLYKSISFWLEVVLTQKSAPASRGSRRGRNAQPASSPASMKLGPCLLTDKTTWDEFLGILVKETCTDLYRVQKVIPSMHWCQTTPAGNKAKLTLPLHDLRTFQVLIQHIEDLPEAKRRSPLYVIINEPPRVGTGGNGHFSWNAEISEQGEKDTPDALETLLGTSRSIDKTLAPIADELRRRIPINNCPRHPGIRCIIYEPKGWHFEGDNNRINVWAQGISRSTTTYDLIPLESKFFKPDQVIKDVRSTTAAAPSAPPALAPLTPQFTSPATPIAHSQFPYPYGWPQTPTYSYNPYTPFPAPLSLTHPYPQLLQTPTQNQVLPQIPQVDDLEAWCRDSLQLKAAAKFATALEILQFEVGDDVSVLKTVTVKAAGLEELEWTRFVKAYNKYLASFRK